MAVAVPGLQRRFAYTRAGGLVATSGTTSALGGGSFRVANEAAPTRHVFVLDVEVDATVALGESALVVIDEAGTLRVARSSTGGADAIAVSVGAERRSVGVPLAGVTSVVLSSDGTSLALATRAAGRVAFDDVARGPPVSTGGLGSLTVGFAACVTKATFWWGDAPPRGVDWAAWWSRVPVLTPGVGVARWDGVFGGAKYAPVCAEAGSRPWSANYARRKIDEVRAAGVNAAGDGYVVWDGSALAVVASPRGATGSTGQRGPPGSTGDAGPAGTITGPGGDAGDAGPTGADGPAGDAGGVGDRGEPGETGGAGPKGATGPAGAAGATGASGDKGPVGPPSGPTGDVGPLGDPGVPGPAGAQGAAGAKGAQGPPGATGPAGAQGAAGPTGGKGDTGPPGAQGRAGIAGASGPGGPAGPPGGWAPTGRYAAIARIPPCNVAGATAPGSASATFDFPAVPLAARRLTATVGAGATLVLAAMRPYEATVGNYSDSIDVRSPAFLAATGLVLTYQLDAPVPVCGYELSTSGLLHRWTLELDGVMCDSRTEEDYALSSVDFTSIPIEPRSASVVRLTVVSCAASAGVRLLLNHTGLP